MMSLRSVLAAIAFLAGPFAGISQAAIIDVSNGGSFGATNTSTTTGPSYGFDDKFYFSSSNNFTLTYEILTTGSTPSMLQTVNYDIYSTASTQPVLIFTPAIFGPVAVGTGGGTGLTAGTYYFDLSGTTTSTGSVTDTVNFGVSAVPLPPALPMFGAALLALVGIGLLRRRGSSVPNVMA